MQEKIDNPIKDFKEKTAEYIDLRIDLLKLEIFEKTSQLTASLATGLIYMILILFFTFSLFLALAFYISKLLNSYPEGFFYSGMLYLILLILFFLFGRNAFKNFVTNKLIQIFTSKTDEEE